MRSSDSGVHRVTRVGGELTAIVFVCDNQPHFTVRVYYGEHGVLNDVPGIHDYTVTGHAQRGRQVVVPLTVESKDWVIAGERRPLPAGTLSEADTEDGSGGRLGAAVYFKVADVPDSPLVLTTQESADEGRPIPLHEFTASAMSVC